MLLRFAWKSALALLSLYVALFGCLALLALAVNGWIVAAEAWQSAFLGMGLTAAVLWLLGILGAVCFKLFDVMESRRVGALDRTNGDQINPCVSSLTDR